MTLQKRQAFIGVGTMGSLMAGCLLDAGIDLAIYDIRRKAAEPLLDRGARWADSAEAAAAGCEIVWTSLPGPTQVESVLLGNEAGVLSAMAEGATLVDTTTNDPDVARRVSNACTERGLAMLDTPVSGRPPTMTMMVGGDREFSSASGTRWVRSRPRFSTSGRRERGVLPSWRPSTWGTPT